MAGPWKDSYLATTGRLPHDFNTSQGPTCRYVFVRALRGHEAVGLKRDRLYPRVPDITSCHLHDLFISVRYDEMAYGMRFGFSGRVPIGGARQDATIVLREGRADETQGSPIECTCHVVFDTFILEASRGMWWNGESIITRGIIRPGGVRRVVTYGRGLFGSPPRLVFRGLFGRSPSMGTLVDAQAAVREHGDNGPPEFNPTPLAFKCHVCETQNPKGMLECLRCFAPVRYLLKDKIEAPLEEQPLVREGAWNLLQGERGVARQSPSIAREKPQPQRASQSVTRAPIGPPIGAPVGAAAAAAPAGREVLSPAEEAEKKRLIDGILKWQHKWDNRDGAHETFASVMAKEGRTRLYMTPGSVPSWVCNSPNDVPPEPLPDSPLYSLQWIPHQQHGRIWLEKNVRFARPAGGSQSRG